MPLAKHDRVVDKATDLDVVYMLRHQVVSMFKCAHDELLLSLSEPQHWSGLMSMDQGSCPLLNQSSHQSSLNECRKGPR
jgi:hypothetical protein